jgi:hypothetical protein
MTANENQVEVKDLSEHENRLKNAQPKYLTEGKKSYLLASSEESLQSLMDNQKAELTKVLIALKSEHDQITLESDKIKRQIDEYDKQINMILDSEKAAKEREEKQKQDLEFMASGIESKKERKNEEEYNKKSLLKQREKINKDLFILQKEIIQYENESQVLDKKLERAGLDQNIIKEKKNQVHSKIENQQKKNDNNANEYDLKIKQYKKMIELKSAFLRFSDERKEIQNQIAQRAKNDALDKQEVEKRKTLKLLMLYNQYLRTLMNEELKENEDLENIFQEIRDIVGTKNLDEIVDFIMNRNKRYNYTCQEIEDCEKMNKKLKKEIKWLKENLVVLKNNLLVNEKDNQKELDVQLTPNKEDEIKMIEKEKEKNKQLLELGKKYNEVDKAYQLVLQNIDAIIETEKQTPLNVQLTQEEEEEKKEYKFELTSDELKNYDDIKVNRSERSELEKYELNDEEKEIVNNIKELTEKDLYELEANVLVEFSRILKKDEVDNDITDEQREIIDEILAIELTEEEKNMAKNLELREDEKKVVTQASKDDPKELPQEKKNQRIAFYKELKIKYRKFLLKEKPINAVYKIKKLKKQKDDLINNYNILLKKVAKTFDVLYLCHSKQEFLNMMNEKKIEISGSSSLRKPQAKKQTRRNTKRMTKRGSVNRRYTATENKYLISENRDEEDDKSNYDPDIKILNKFMKEQNKEKENFITGKTKIEEVK